MFKKIFFLLLVNLMVFNFAVAAEWDDYTVKSVKDPLYIELADSIHSYVPTSVTVHINDELTKEKANYVGIDPYNDTPYTENGNQVFTSYGGEFRGAMKYNGEDSISFGFRPTNGTGDTSSIVVKFVHAEVVPEGANTNIHDENSKYYNYISCNREYNELFCKGAEGCQVCYKYISIVDRDYMVNETNVDVQFPSDMDKEKESISVSSSGASSVKEISHANGAGTYREHERYSIAVITDTYPLSSDYIDEIASSNINYGFTKESIASPIGGAQAYLFYKAPEINNGGSNIAIQFEIYSDLSPVGSGILDAKATINTFLKDGEENVAIEELKNNLLSTVGSLKLSPGKIINSSDELKHRYSLYERDEKEEESEELVAYGSITDVFDNPLPYMKIRIVSNGVTVRGVTDEDGNFKVPLVGIEVGDEDVDAHLVADLRYERDDKIYYNLHFLKDNGRYVSGYVAKKFKISKEANPEIRFKLHMVQGDNSLNTSLSSFEEVDHAGVIYYHMHESVDFYLTELNLTLDHKLPVAVWVGNTTDVTAYSPTDSDIYIAASSASNSDSDRPKNREYHEFSHHVMYDVYGAWPKDDSLPVSVNHGGFMNPNTADSFVEGFAEFMALVIGDKLGQDKSDIYAGFGSMERNYRPWDSAGEDEEFAVASLLWDLYDNDNDPGDDLYYSLETIWDVIKVNRKSFYEYYLAFKAAKPKDVDKIDALFIAHGFYQDTRVGNKEYDTGEPRKFTSGNSGPFTFIDLSGVSKKIEYKKGFTVGYAANYERPDRQSAVKLKNAFLKIENDEVDFYTIRITDTVGNLLESEYTVELADGKVYIQPLPANVEATITVSPKTKDYSVKNVYTVSNQVLLEKILSTERDMGYFDEHEYVLEPTGTNVDEKFVLYSGVKPTQAYAGDLGAEIEIKLDEDDIFGKTFDDENRFSLLRLFIIILVSVYGYFYYKSVKVKKHTHEVLKMIKKYLILAGKWFIANGIPFLKKWVIFSLEILIKVLKWLKLMIVKKIKEYKSKK